MLANDHGADFYRIHHAMTTNYERAKDLPRPGFAAGPCLFKDAMELAAFNNGGFYMGHAAMLVNEGLPNYVVNMLKRQHDLREKTVGILGMAFKANIDDKRESLSYKLKKILLFEAKEVLCSDSNLRAEKGLVSSDELLRKSDIIIIGAPHREYRNLRVPEGKILVDDREDDDTLPVLTKLSPPFPVRTVRNHFGRGALNAIKSGFREAHCEA